MTDNNTYKSALVTGATSGLGFEAAAQLAESGYARITITGRSIEGAEAARAELVTRTGRIFDTLALDLDKPKSVQDATAELADRGEKFDFIAAERRHGVRRGTPQNRRRRPRSHMPRS